MVTKNYARLGAGLYVVKGNASNVAGHVYIRDINGELKENLIKSTYVSGKAWSYIQSILIETSLRSLTSGEGAGMFLGIGNTPATQDDYKLDNILEFSNDGLTVVSEILNHMVDENTLYNYVLTVKNNSMDAISISESGLIVRSGYDMPAPITFLVARDTFEPVILQPGETRPFTMTIGLE